MKKAVTLLFIFMMSIIFSFAQTNKPWLCFTAVESNVTVKLTTSGSPTPVSLETSVDGDSWNAYTINEVINLTNIGSKIYFRNTTTSESFSIAANNYYQFVIGYGKVSASGSVMSLLDRDCSTNSVSDYAFCKLFYNCDKLTSAPELPATTLGNFCYAYMFQRSGIVIAPVLPATTLQTACYYYMFDKCSALTTVPALPAVSLVKDCYSSMFKNCTRLSTISVGFNGWSESTNNWMEYVIGKDLTFNCPNEISSESKSVNTIPSQTTINIWNKVTLNSGGYATYSSMTPFSVPEGTTAYSASVNVSSDVITLHKLTGNIPAGTGVLLCGTPNTEVILPVETDASPLSSNDFMATTTSAGTLVAKPSTGYTFALASDNIFLHYTGNAFIHNRAYLYFDEDPAPAQSSGKSLKIVFADEETKINELASSQCIESNCKVIENGRVVIKRNGFKYNTAGQIMK